MANGSDPASGTAGSGSVGQGSVRQGLIELEFGDRLRIRGIEFGGLIEPEVSLWWGAGGTQQRRPAGKIEIGENGAYGNGIRNEGDDSHRSTTGRADERQDIIDASDEGGPSRRRTPAWGGAA
jgi:hypothetical protein